ncbi:Uracil-DNA glycosylase, family 4 [hydrothermal vent metagenome]|uniref:Type-4 uracil-DNA glycosylase n=1 Tax=hydrothermal vent metagenome TaxID=652676 RepID=A0A3B0ZB75_9ZZZZ
MAITEQQRRQYLRAMGIEVWQQQNSSAESEPELSNAGLLSHDDKIDTGTDNRWNKLEQRVAHCQACVLHEQRIQSVLGTGNCQADWMIIGEAPGADEDKQGEPFVGRAGKLLNTMLFAAGFERADVYICNIVKCRPPQNRDPRPEEVAHCSAYLQQQIDWVQPKLILAVGRISAQQLLQSGEPVGRLRGKVHQWGALKIPLVVTYHPAYLLRAPREKRKAWTDLKLALSV